MLPSILPISQQSVSHLDVVLLRDGLASAAPSNEYAKGHSNLEFSASPLAAAAFDPHEEWAAKIGKIECLFEWALAHRFLVCSGYRAMQPSASLTGQALGRTPLEQFVIEQFFAHGFRSGSGNEPWHEPLENAPSDLARDQVKQARKQFEHWKNTVGFFTEAGCPAAVGIAGARLRHETLDPKGDRSAQFWALLHTPVYAPLMTVFLSADAQGEWLVKEQDLAVFSRGLNGDIGKLLLSCQDLVAPGADPLAGPETKAAFFFECSWQIFLAMAASVKSPLRRTRLEVVRDGLRSLYEKSFAITLTQAPNAWWENPEQLEARVAAVKHKIRETEDKIWDLLPEPLTRKVASAAREAIQVATQARLELEALVAPRLSLENPKNFEKSVASLGEWFQRRHSPASTAWLAPEDRLIQQLAELRILAEEGAVVAALDLAVALMDLLKKSQKARLEPFFAALSRLLLAPLKQQLHQGQRDQANACAEQARLLLAGTPALAEFEQAFKQCLQAQAADTAAAARLLAPSRVPPAPGLEARAKQAQALLRDYADELALGENLLEQQFLQTIASGLVFSRKEKLENRLRKLTRWGGREPHVTSLKLLRSIIEGQ